MSSSFISKVLVLGHQHVQEIQGVREALVLHIVLTKREL